MSIEQVYERVVRELSEGEQIRLASLILWKCAGNGHVEYSEEWSDDEVRDFGSASADLIERRFGNE